MVAVNHVRLTRVGGDDNKWHFHVGSSGLGSFLMSFQDIVDGRRLAKQVEVGVCINSQYVSFSSCSDITHLQRLCPLILKLSFPAN
jgi:hypothetical protein